MAAVCSICVQMNQNKPAVSWCPECTEGLCTNCTQQHKLMNATRDHDTIPYLDYEKLPPFIKSVRLVCRNHGEKYQYFCRAHDQPVCKSCLVESHSKCQDIPVLSDIIENVKTSSVFYEIKSELNNAHEAVQGALENRSLNLNSIQNLRQSLKEEITCKTNEFIAKIKGLEQNMLSEIDKVVREIANPMTDIVMTLESNERKLREVHEQLEHIQQFASNYQIYVGIKEIEKMVTDSLEYVDESIENGAMNDVHISIQASKFLEAFTEINTLGEIRVTEGPKPATMYTRKIQEAQMVVQKYFPQRLQLCNEIDVENVGWFSDCCCLSDGTIVMANRGIDTLFVHKTDGTLKSKFKFRHDQCVYGVELLDTEFLDDRVLVSNPISKTISLFDIRNNKVIEMKKVRVANDVNGISQRGDQLLITVCGVGLKMLNVNTNKIEDIIDDVDLDIYSYVATDNRRICYTCLNKNTVTVLNIEFRVLFTFRDTTILKGPKGVTFDRQGYLYVTGYWTNNLVVISPDGQTSKQLLGAEDGLHQPSAVCYDSSSNLLTVIADELGLVKQYSLT